MSRARSICLCLPGILLSEASPVMSCVNSPLPEVARCQAAPGEGVPPSLTPPCLLADLPVCVLRLGESGVSVLRKSERAAVWCPGFRLRQVCHGWELSGSGGTVHLGPGAGQEGGQLPLSPPPVPTCTGTPAPSFCSQACLTSLQPPGVAAAASPAPEGASHPTGPLLAGGSCGRWAALESAGPASLSWPLLPGSGGLFQLPCLGPPVALGAQVSRRGPAASSLAAPSGVCGEAKTQPDVRSGCLAAG